MCGIIIKKNKIKKKTTLFNKVLEGLKVNVSFIFNINIFKTTIFGMHNVKSYKVFIK